MIKKGENMKKKGNEVLRLWGTVSLFLIILFSAVSIQGTAEAKGKGKVRKHSCIGCHRGPASSISPDHPFPEGSDPSSFCLDCHNYQGNHHPVNVIPVGADANTGDLNSFPLFQGEIKCLTCHEIHGDGGPRLLRGGPYGYRNEICFRCHDRDLNTKITPHRMLDADGYIREVNGEPICTLCHTRIPEQNGMRSEVTFKADVAFLCWRCHPPMEGEFFRKHFLVKPRQGTLEHMQSTEREKGVLFPLLNRDRITCSTCHNPHEVGVIQYGPAQAGAGLHDSLRMPKEAICSGCHAM